MKGHFKLIAGIGLFALLLTGCNSSTGGKNSFTITWKNYNGTILEIDNNVKKGTIPTYDGITPTRPDDDEYTYTWSGWDPEVTAATSNQTYTATYSYERLTTTYTITYELNGGINNPSNPSSYTIEDGTITLNAPTRNGYTFDGWYDSPSFNNKITEIKNGSYGDLVLYAKWTPIVYSITYNLDGGTNSLSNPSTYTIESTFDFADATKTGYQFAGWFDNDGNRMSSIAVGSTGSLTLTAHWTANLNRLSVTSEDTTKGTVTITLGSGYSNESITVVATPIEDCVFKGWYHESTKVSDSASYTFIMPINDYSLIAHFFTKAEEEAWNVAHSVIPTLSVDGKTITYGLYPQKNVNDATLISALNALTTPESNGWYLYNNGYYAKESVTPDNSGYKTFDNETTIVSGTTYWFKCEPITWDVLSNANGEYYILSSVLLDAHCFYNSTSSRTIDGNTIYANNYEYSDIRTWLNNDFYNSAFALNNSYIQTTTVDNSTLTTKSSPDSHGCNNTQDKVFLPSYKDYINSSYGFSTSTSHTDTRYCKTTDWARVRGAFYFGGSYQYNGYYWTRSPLGGDLYDYVHEVDGIGSFMHRRVDYTDVSVRPALTIKIS